MLVDGGQTILRKDKHGILVKCGKNAYLIKALQLPGSKMMAVDAFVNGGKNILNPGDILLSPTREESK